MVVRIRDGRPSDAPEIAEAVMSAVGEKICNGMIGEGRTIEDVRMMFTFLASLDDSQYSWRNTRVAESEDGTIMGICVSYDGDDLLRLRKAFMRETQTRLGWSLSDEDWEKLDPETVPEEFYLDSLEVNPKYRGHGIGKLLIHDAYERARLAGKPLGLLVDDENMGARKLYDSLGFLEVCRRPFAGEMMTNLRLPIERV